MADTVVTSYYFKLIGKKTYFFKVDTFKLTESEHIVYFYFCNAGISFPTTRAKLEEDIQQLMLKHGLKYEEITNTVEIEAIKLLYEE